MAVVIDSGPVEATDRLEEVPREKWGFLMRERRDFLHRSLSYDCRCLVGFIDDAKFMFKELGFSSLAAMIRDGYELEPEEISVALDWLRLNPPDEPLSLDTAVKLGKLRAVGRPKMGEDKGYHDNLSQRGASTAYIIARLERDAESGNQKAAELLEQVRAKQITANAAAVMMGWRKKLTRLELAIRAYNRLTQSEQSEFQRCIA